MRRLLLLLSAFGLGLLAWGTTYYPDFAVFWLASGDTTYQTVRFALMGALFIQFVTNPPRHMYNRIICGLISVSAAVWTIEASYAYTMPALDTLIFLASSIATGITALEISYEPQEYKTRKHVFVG